MPKFTYEEHQERMRKILTQAMPVERPDVLGSLLERVRGRRPEAPTGVAPPRLPRQPKFPRRPI